MPKKLLLSACFLLSASFVFADEFPRYKIQASIDTNSKTIQASQEVEFTNTSSRGINEIYFHVYSNRQYTKEERSFMQRYASYFKVSPPPDFTKNIFHIDRLEVNSSQGQFSLEGKDKTLLKVTLQKPLAAGEKTTIHIDFHLTVPHSYGRFGWYKDIMALARWYPILSVLGPDGWDQSPFYPFHRPFFSDSSYYTVDLTVPASEIVVHSGDIAQEKIEGDTKKIHIESSQPIREFALAMSPRYQVYEDNKSGILFKAYYLDQNLPHAQLAVKDAQDLMEAYTKRFTAYPYKTFSIAPVHLAYGGEQMPNMIFIDTRVFELPSILDRYFDFLIAHEAGHQWFYNLVGVNNYTQMWLEEGLTAYFTMEYIADKYGPNAAVVEMPDWLKVFIPELQFKRVQDMRYKIASRIGFERPVIDKLSSFREPSSIFTFTYGKGSKVVGMLKRAMGEESFDRTFKKLFVDFRYKNLDILEFQKLIQNESNRDLTAFLEQWLYSTKTLDAKINSVHGQKIDVSHSGGIQVPEDIHIRYQDGTEEKMTWEANQIRETLVVPSNKKIKSVTIDEAQELLDVNRVNNHYPRRVYAKLVPMYHPLYEIPVFLADDGYHWITGPALADGLGVKTSFQKPYDYIAYAQGGYSFGDQLMTTRQGVEIKNVFHSQTVFGIEAMQRADYDNGEDDLNSQKVYLRKELWPAPFSLTEINDHITLYAVRNRTPSGSLLSTERTDHTSYLKHDEAIVGATLHLDRAGTHPDVQQGYATDLLVENSGHWAGATQTFTRASIDQKFYHPVPVVAESKMAYRLKYGWGSSDDKNLYELGGMDGLRGFDRKTIRGSDMLLGSVEYRFPLLSSLHVSTPQHILGLEKISGAAFFDAGQAWRDNFDEGKFHKDVGLGLRFHVSIGSFLENVLVRLDIARAIDEPKEDTHTWFGINQAF